MARAGETIDVFFEFDAVTGSPSAVLKSFDGVGALVAVSGGGAVAFQKVASSPPTEIWAARVTVPDSASPGSYVIEGTVVDSSVEKRIIHRVEVTNEDFRSLIDDISAPGREKEIGNFIVERINRITKVTLRTLNAQINRSPVEVEQIDVVFTRTKITAGDTPLFTFVVFDPTTNILVDLTGATITFKGVDAANTSVVAWDRECTILDAEQGSCEVRLTSTDTATPTLYDGIVEALLPGNQKLTSPIFAVNILPQAA